MIIGSGDIASAIHDRDDLLFFASGVSNSQETRASEYVRERELLTSQDRSAHLVYFSTLAVFYSTGRYVNHKRSMESMVKTFDTWTIIRLGNITWGTNPHTLINNLRKQNKDGAMNIQNTYRYICEMDELHHWLDKIPSWSCEINIPGKRMKVSEVVEHYV